MALKQDKDGEGSVRAEDGEGSVSAEIGRGW